MSHFHSNAVSKKPFSHKKCAGAHLSVEKSVKLICQKLQLKLLLCLPLCKVKYPCTCNYLTIKSSQLDPEKTNSVVFCPKYKSKKIICSYFVAGCFMNYLFKVNNDNIVCRITILHYHKVFVVTVIY